MTPGSNPIDPFEIHVEDEVIEDLIERISRTRWPGEITDSGWDYGSNLSYVMDLCDYWKNTFNWREQESRINTFQNFTTNVSGLNIHFIQEKGKGPNPIPLVITHGWPSTFAEMLDIIPLLTDPGSHGGDASDSFDVVVPSLPGYGYSEKPSNPGMDVAEIARLWVELMTSNLGYSSFTAQGGDWGAGVTTALAANHSDRLRAIHLTMSSTGTDIPSHIKLSEEERDFINHRNWWQENEGAYGHIQRTKPQTLAYGLTDSPAGLASWIVEKWRAWSDCGGDIESRFTKDQLLTHLTIYWVTQTIESSIRLYYESGKSGPIVSYGNKVDVPTSFASFPVEISYPPREWLERFFNLKRFTKMPSGGHFSATEEPGLLAEDIRESFRFLR
jgi:microsomal epoxide hydrolase